MLEQHPQTVDSLPCAFEYVVQSLVKELVNAMHYLANENVNSNPMNEKFTRKNDARCQDRETL